MQPFRSLLVATAACLLAAGPTAAQTTFASITGAITDPTGASFPNAGVEATFHPIVADYDGSSAREFRMGVRLEW